MKMRKRLSPQLLALLDEIIQKREIDPQLKLALVENRHVSEHARELLLDAMAAEFSETGLSQGDEPSARGLQIEELIDWTNDICKPLETHQTHSP